MKAYRRAVVDVGWLASARRGVKAYRRTVIDVGWYQVWCESLQEDCY